MADRPETFGPTRGFSGWPIQRNHAKCCGADPCCHGNEIWARSSRLPACHVCLSVTSPTVAILNQFWWKFAPLFGTQNVRSRSLGIKSDDSVPYFRPVFTSVMHFQWKGLNSEHHTRPITRPVDRLSRLTVRKTLLSGLYRPILAMLINDPRFLAKVAFDH